VDVKSAKARSRGISRHLEGWQPAVLAIILAGSTALIAVPRPVDPIEVPDPQIDMREIAGVMRTDAERAEAADRKRLDIDVLELGSVVFAYGEAEAAGDEDRLVQERRRVIDAAARAVRVDEAQVFALRAHHLRSFLRELRRWAATGEESQKLRQVGGGVAAMLKRNGWLRDGRLVADDAVLAVMFKKRWNEVTALEGEAFAPSLGEQKILYRFLLHHPARPASSSSGAGAEVRRSVEIQYRLKKIEELASVDASYPTDLAKGVLYYSQGRYPLAVESFRRHLDAAPDGPYTIRAQNYLRAALEHAREEM